MSIDLLKVAGRALTNPKDIYILRGFLSNTSGGFNPDYYTGFNTVDGVEFKPDYFDVRVIATKILTTSIVSANSVMGMIGYYDLSVPVNFGEGPIPIGPNFGDIQSEFNLSPIKGVNAVSLHSEANLVNGLESFHEFIIPAGNYPLFKCDEFDPYIIIDLYCVNEV